MRVENVKGAVWTVDEIEYHRRRPQRGTGSSGGSSGGGSGNSKISSPTPGPGNASFYETSNILGGHPPVSEVTPIPPHLTGLSFEQQAYLHGLANPFHNQQRTKRYMLYCFDKKMAFCIYFFK